MKKIQPIIKNILEQKQYSSWKERHEDLKKVKKTMKAVPWIGFILLIILLLIII